MTRPRPDSVRPRKRTRPRPRNSCEAEAKKHEGGRGQTPKYELKLRTARVALNVDFNAVKQI